MTTTPYTAAVPALTVQPIHFTSDFGTRREFYLKLGLRPTDATDPMATVLAADSGQLMLAEVPSGHELDGLSLVEFTVPDVDAHAAPLQAAGVEVTRVQLAHRRQECIAVDLPQGRVHIGPELTHDGAAAFDPAGLNIGALLYCPAETVSSGAHSLGPYGLTPRIASDHGGWTDLIDNGVFAFHQGTLRALERDTPQQPVVQIFGETGNVDFLAEELSAAGLEATVIDEAYGRSLRIQQPDGTQFQFNESQQDLYGFHRLSS